MRPGGDRAAEKWRDGGRIASAMSLGNAILPPWIDVPTGTFRMGGGPRSNENPAHEVTVSAFRLARTPITRATYADFLRDTGHPAPSCWRHTSFANPRQPVVGPSWFDARAFCAWASERTGIDVRLPTEAEWERAAKADREVLYPWGDAPPETLPDYARRWRDGPEPVDAYPSLHPWGFLGLGENVHEWCADWYDADGYSRRVDLESPVVDPRGPAEGRRRASRGGAWRHAIKVSRCAARSSIPPDKQYEDYGFRVATDAVNEPSK